jgi:hypothetical protein
MTTSKTFSGLSRVAAVLAAGTVLLAAADGASARNGGNSNDHGEMRSSQSSRISGDHDMESRESNRASDRSANVSQKDKAKDGDKYSEKHKDKGEEYSEKTKDKDKDKNPGTTTANKNPPAPGTQGTNTIHPIPSPSPVASSPGSPTGVTPVNTIHPILSPPPAASSSGTPITPPENTIVRDHRHPADSTIGPQSGVKADGYTGWVTHGGLGGGPAPPDKTSTTTQY